MPVVNVKIDGFFALAVKAITVDISDHSINTQSLLVSHIETKRGNIHGYGDTQVIGIDLGQNILLLCIFDGLGCATH
jgi:hypothetical protein